METLENLFLIVKAAVMAAITAAPFDGKPLRLANIEGRTVIDSVDFKDGVDDGGMVDFDRNRQVGHLAFRRDLPASR